MPPKDAIEGYDLEAKNQYWRAPADLMFNPKYPTLFFDFKSGFTTCNSMDTRYDSKGRLSSLSYEDTVKLYHLKERELKRREKGHWVWINGVATFLTGGHYGSLAYAAIKNYRNPHQEEHPYMPGRYNQYGEFRKYLMYFHYIRQYGKDHKKITGLVTTKAKKTAVTMTVSHDYLNESTLQPEKRFNMMSENEKKCLDNNFEYYMYAFDRFPDVFKPSVRNRTTKEINFNTPIVKSTGTRNAAEKQLDSEEGFDTIVAAKPTVAGAFDGTPVYRGHVDEFTKLEDPYPLEVYMRTKETVKLGIGEKIGFLDFTAYPPEVDGKNLDEAHEIDAMSALSTMDEITGRTTSGFISYFISAEEVDPEGFDIYGECNKERSNAIIMAERRKVENNPAALQAIIRQYPIVPEEVWRVSGGSNAAFDTIRISLQYNDIIAITKSGQPPYIEGNLRWKGERFGEVEFVPTTEAEKQQLIQGKFKIYGKKYMKDEWFNLPFKQQLKDRQGKWKPSSEFWSAGATDPTDFMNKEDVGEGSKDAITCIILPETAIDQTFGKVVTNRMYLQYLCRPDNPDEYYEDVVMAMMWTGGVFWVEGNKGWLHKRLLDDDMHNFMLFKSSDTGLPEMYSYIKFKEGKQKPLITVKTGKEGTVQDFIVAVRQHLRKPEKEGEFDYLTNVESLELLDQARKFKSYDTKKYDLMMCFGLNRLCVKAILAHRLGIARKEPGLNKELLKKMWATLIR